MVNQPPRHRLDMRATLQKVSHALERRYGSHAHEKERMSDPLDVLIETILSQNTTSVNCQRAVSAMRAAFPTWDDVLAAPRSRLEQTLKPAGLARVRSGRIQRILRAIKKDHGRLDLDFLQELSDDDARRALLDFEGVGPKTADCVLLFALQRNVFPVDTHIHRILTRLEFIPRAMSVEKSHAFLLPHIPRGAHLALHLNLIEHGRNVCRPARPRCEDCVLLRSCPYGLQRQASPPTGRK